MRTRFVLLLFFLAACSTPPEQPSPQPDPGPAQQAADAAFKELNKDVGVYEGEKDLSSVAMEASGAITNMDNISEPTGTEIAKFAPGEPGWVEVEETRVFSNSVAPDRARQELLQILRNTAVSKKVPANIEVTSLLTDMMSEVGGQANEQTAWSGFFRSTVSGVITAEEVLLDNMKPLNGKNSYEKTVRLKAYVEPVQGQRDLNFNVEIALENNLLKSGDELVFSVTPSKDCFVYVFNLMADQNVMLMFPNEFLQENYVQGAATLQIPDPEIRRYIKFRVSTIPGEELTSESIYIVCTKEEVPVVRDLPKIGKSLKVFSGNSQSFVKLQRWLTNIPLNQRVEKNVVYHVSNN